MFEKLLTMEQRYDDINTRLADPDIIGDRAQYAALMKEHKTLTPIMEAFRVYKEVRADFEEARELLDSGEQDAELKEMAQIQFEDSRSLLEEQEQTLKILLLPKDPNDDKNVIVEIRGGAGGEEAALFAGSLYRMYSMYAAAHRWKQEVMNASPTELGGFKEISFSIEGEGAYSRLKYESGVHRVQRVPETESQGRIHTSTVLTLIHI
ncbi:MAG: PCRF domain-containing protein, partial [Oscillospiraceae bacterium]|nr:PCRF domain-containing protein [Oscillospiraceae bacterium]